MGIANSIAAKAAKGIAQKSAMRIAARVIGKGFGVVGLGVGAYSSVKMYSTFKNNDPANTRMRPLKAELEKWGSAISCIGREPYEFGAICSVEDTDAIRLLGIRELFNYPNSRYPAEDYGFDLEYHVNPARFAGRMATGETETDPSLTDRILYPDPERSIVLINKAMEYVSLTKDMNLVPNFASRKRQILTGLKSVADSIPESRSMKKDYTQQQQTLSAITSQMKPIEQTYREDLNRKLAERHSRRWQYAGMAAVSALIGLSPEIMKKK